MKKFCLCLALFFTGSLYASEEFEYGDLVSFVESGGCESSRNVAKENKRLISLLFLEDILLSVRGQDGFVRRFVGDISSFKIGRNVDPTLVKLYSYSTRKDVAIQVDKDIENITAAMGGYVP